MPHVIPALAEKSKLYKIIESKESFDVAYRMRQCDTISVPQMTRSAASKPRWVIIGFQTGKEGDQDESPSIFNHVNVRNVNLMLNSDKYPLLNYNASFPKQQYSEVFRDIAEFLSRFYHMDDLVSNSNITPSDFKSLCPLFVIDVSKQSERLKNSITDRQIETEFNENVPAGTNAFALVISDRVMRFGSDGNKTSVITGGGVTQGCPYPISQIFYPPISHIPDFLPPNIPYPRFHSQLTISQILQD